MIIHFLIILAFLVTGDNSFRNKQQTFPRVKTAYQHSHNKVSALFRSKGINLDNAEVFFKVHKLEQELEVWSRKKGDKTFILVHTYEVCHLSGDLGPKRKIGDFQTPEGFYFIDRFNPASSYHLSLGINYPNKCDKFNCTAKDPGGDIFIHGKCVTIGCLPMTDEKIEELYIIAVEARNSGQHRIPVAIFPFRMTASNLGSYLKKPEYSKHETFWRNLQTGFEMFEKEKNLPEVLEGKDGLYSFK